MSNSASDREASGSSASDTQSDEPFVNSPPAGCVWKRPTLRFVTRQVNLYVREAIFKEIFDMLTGMGRNTDVGAQAIGSLTGGVLGRLMKVRRSGSTITALHHLIAHQLEGDQIPPDESWFQVCGRTIRFTAHDFAMITGLHFGNSNFHPQDDHPLRSNGIFHMLIHDKNIKVSVLRKKFIYVKVANILIYYYFILCRDDMMVEMWVWALVEDFEQWNMFPWGAYAYGVLSYYIGSVALKEGQEHKDYQFYGPVWALQIWSYEMIPSLGDLCGTRDKFVEVPRCLMWTTRKTLCDFTHFFDEKHKVFPSLPHLEEDEVEYYYLSFENGSPFDVQFIRPVRITVNVGIRITKTGFTQRKINRSNRIKPNFKTDRYKHRKIEISKIRR
ncbi:hypothetical protein OROMI_033415 [Orobanche minor]